MTTTNKNSQDELIASMSPSAFVTSCLLLAIAHGAEPINFEGFEVIAQELFNATWIVWITMAISLLIMLGAGLSTLRNQIAALVVGVIGSLFVLTSAVFQTNWLVMMILLFAVLIPASSAAFIKMTATETKSQARNQE